MTFCIKITNTNKTSSQPLIRQIMTDSHKLANNILLDQPQIHKYGEHLLYYPSKTSTYVMDIIDNNKLQTINYDKEDFLFDKNTNKWNIVKINK